MKTRTFVLTLLFSMMLVGPAFAAAECYNDADCPGTELCDEVGAVGAVFTTCVPGTNSLQSCSAQEDCPFSFQCVDDYCKNTEVKCDNENGACTVDAAGFSCSCEAGSGTGGGGAEPEFKSGAEFYKDCLFELDFCEEGSDDDGTTQGGTVSTTDEGSDDEGATVSTDEGSDDEGSSVSTDEGGSGVSSTDEGGSGVSSTDEGGSGDASTDEGGSGVSSAGSGEDTAGSSVTSGGDTEGATGGGTTSGTGTGDDGGSAAGDTGDGGGTDGGDSGGGCALGNGPVQSVALLFMMVILLLATARRRRSE
jgi:hypothetical protein